MSKRSDRNWCPTYATALSILLPT